MGEVEMTVAEDGAVHVFFVGMTGFVCDDLIRELETLMGRSVEVDLPLAYAPRLMAEQAARER